MKHRTPLSLKLTAILLGVLFLGGCSSAIDNQGYSYDPWQPFNRKVFAFNETMDKFVLKPVAKTYDFVLPHPVRTGVHNFFSNLSDVGNLFNAIIQLNGKATAGIAARVIDNTFFGLGGIFDVATPMGNPKISRNFGSTLAHYGVQSGPYLVLPFLGPTTVRDGIGKIPDYFTYPVSYVPDKTWGWTVRGVDVVQHRAALLPLEKQFEGTTTDKYATMRDAWLQHRWGELGTPVHSDTQEIDALFAPQAAPAK